MTNSIQNQAVDHTEQQTLPGKIISNGINGIKIIWLATWLVIATVLVAMPILTLSVFRRSRHIFFFVRLWARIILRISGVTLTTRGLEKIIADQSYVIISNHQSHFDGPSLAAGLKLQLHWIAKRELSKIPVFGHALKAAGTIFIDRGDREAAMKIIDEGIKDLPKAAGIMVFAEGTRSPKGLIGKFKKGGFIVAIQTGFPILPVTIKGSSYALPKSGVVFNPGPIEVIVGDSIDSSSYTMEQMDELIKKTRDTIAANYQ